MKKSKLAAIAFAVGTVIALNACQKDTQEAKNEPQKTGVDLQIQTVFNKWSKTYKSIAEPVSFKHLGKLSNSQVRQLFMKDEAVYLQMEADRKPGFSRLNSMSVKSGSAFREMVSHMMDSLLSKNCTVTALHWNGKEGPFTTYALVADGKIVYDQVFSNWLTPHFTPEPITDKVIRETLLKIARTGNPLLPRDSEKVEQSGPQDMIYNIGMTPFFVEDAFGTKVTEIVVRHKLVGLVYKFSHIRTDSVTRYEYVIMNAEPYTRATIGYGQSGNAKAELISAESTVSPGIPVVNGYSTMLWGWAWSNTPGISFTFTGGGASFTIMPSGASESESGKSLKYGHF